MFSEWWLDAGVPCLGLASLACSVAKLRLSTQIAIIARSTTSSITELLGTEEHDHFCLKCKNILLWPVFCHLRYCCSAVDQRINHQTFWNLSRNASPTIKSLLPRARWRLSYVHFLKWKREEFSELSSTNRVFDVVQIIDGCTTQNFRRPDLLSCLIRRFRSSLFSWMDDAD